MNYKWSFSIAMLVITRGVGSFFPYSTLQKLHGRTPKRWAAKAADASGTAGYSADGVATSLAPGEDPEPDAWQRGEDGWLDGGTGDQLALRFSQPLQDDIYIYICIIVYIYILIGWIQQCPQWYNTTPADFVMVQPLDLGGDVPHAPWLCVFTARLAGNLLFSWMIIYIKKQP